jgi:serine/arginine repetitive matrix protein 1
MAGNFFRGTSVEQDGRWGKSDQKLLDQYVKEGKFSAVFDTKVNMKKVNLDVISKWITQRITQEIGFEDEILVNTVINMLQVDEKNSNNQSSEVDPKKMAISLSAFLESKNISFVEALWTLLVDAQVEFRL